MNVLTALSVTTLFLCVLSARGADSKFAANLFGSADNLKFIQTASVVKAVRMKAPFDAASRRPDYAKMRDLANYTLDAPVEMTPEQIATLRGILSDPSIDDPDSSKGCIPNFGVRFTFSDGTRSIDINLCYQCDLIWTSEGNKIIGGGDFDPAHEKLTFLARLVFPTDKGIQLMPANEAEKQELRNKARESKK